MRIKFFVFFLLFSVFLFAKQQAVKPEPKMVQEVKSEEKKHPLSMWGEFFFWHVDENSLEYIFDESEQTMIAGEGVSGDIKRATFEWHGGFRVGLGYNISNYYEIEASYANFNPYDSQTINRHAQEELRGTFPHDESIGIYKATSYVSFTSHFADLLLKKKWNASKNIDITLFSGFSMMWTKQNWVVNYYDDDNINRRFKPYWTYKGGGVRIGTLIDWKIPCGFAVCCKGSVAPVFGNYDNRFAAYDINMITKQKTKLVASHLDDFRVVSNLNFSLGFSWQKEFCWCLLRLFAAYEINTWFNLSEVQHQIFYEGDPNTYALPYILSSVISTQGLTTGINFYF